MRLRGIVFCRVVYGVIFCPGFCDSCGSIRWAGCQPLAAADYSRIHNDETCLHFI